MNGERKMKRERRVMESSLNSWKDDDKWIWLLKERHICIIRGERGQISGLAKYNNPNCAL